MSNYIPEKIIEDILTSDKSILSEVLSLNFSDLSLIARQKIVSSGKLDMIYLHLFKILVLIPQKTGFDEA